MTFKEDFTSTEAAAHAAGVYDSYRKAWRLEVLAAIVGKRKFIRPSVIFMKVLTTGS